MLQATQNKRNLVTLTLLLQLTAVACRGFGDFQAAPPSGFSYPGSPFVITQGIAMTPAKPSLNGTVTSCVSDPALPTGLALDPTSCIISGTPTTLQAPTGYNITASNPTGSATTTISIEINQNPPAALAYAGNPFTFTQGNSVGSVVATFTGSATGCASVPALPTGLFINATTCEITGTPSTPQASSPYTITVSNAFGSTNTVINITVSAETTPPSTPTAFNATPISGAQIDLTWAASTDNISAQGNLIYEICRVTGSGGCIAFTVTHTTGAGAVTFSSTGLTAGTTYYFVIRARDEANNTSIASAEVSAMTTPAGTVSNPVLAPAPGTYNITQNVSATVASPASSTVCYSTTGVDPVCDGTKLACSSGNLYSVAVAVSVTTTFKAVGCKPTYTDSAVTTGSYTIDSVLPTTPAPFNANPVSMTQIDLSWSAASDNLTPVGSIVYEICRATSPGGCGTFTATHTTAAGATNFSSTGLTAGTTYYFVIRSRDQANNTSTVSGEISAMTTPAGTVSNPVFSPPAGTYNANQNVTITVASPASPTICYSTNGVDPSCDALTKLICTSGTSYSGPVTVAGGQTLKAIGCKLTYSDSAVTAGLYTVDATPPTVTGVTASTADGTYNTGATISIQVSFTEPVNVTGTPTLSLATGSPATTPVGYVSGSGTTTLTFDYLVANGNTSADLDYSAVTSLVLAGGSIQDAVGNNADLTLPTPGTANSLSANKAIVIDAELPIITSAQTLDLNNDGKLDTYRITFNKPMNDSSFPGFSANALGSITANWQIAGYTGVRLVHGAAVAGTPDNPNDNILYLRFDQNVMNCDAGSQTGCDSGMKPDLMMSTAGLTASNGSTLAVFGAGAVIETDGARPVPVATNAPNNVTVHVIFSEMVAPITAECGAGSSQPGTNCNTRYTITGGAGLTVNSAIMQGGAGVNGPVVVLTTSLQSNGTPYTISITGGIVLDMATNPVNPPANAVMFTGAL